MAVPARAADALDCPATPAALVTSLHVNARGEELRFQGAAGTLCATLKERLMPTKSFACVPVKDGADCREDGRDAAQLCLVLWSVTGACTSALLAEHLGLDATTPRVQEAAARVQAQITAQPPERLQSWKRPCTRRSRSSSASGYVRSRAARSGSRCRSRPMRRTSGPRRTGWNRGPSSRGSRWT